MRKPLVVSLLAAFALVAVAGGAVAAVHVTHPRDEIAFVDYLQTYGNTSGTTRPFDLPPTDQLLAEGDRACEWLNGQPWALWRNDPELRNNNRQHQYLDCATEPLAWAPADPNRPSVVSGAWAYLCPASVELRMPHRPRSKSD